jgi:hypothetical protein
VLTADTYTSVLMILHFKLARQGTARGGRQEPWGPLPPSKSGHRVRSVRDVDEAGTVVA